ncbi:CLUMA_CG008339, isoform A [Clunio marinus]|uniref:CLUMA_CG008339, isoform A n=1 Tax=Clunio marinus TaxID=568069 RepID=A0A1J1I3D3_9DIPT|nr:CLUMA_CG008339, isoform A [Clunio marinus]
MKNSVEVWFKGSSRQPQQNLLFKCQLLVKWDSTYIKSLVTVTFNASHRSALELQRGCYLDKQPQVTNFTRRVRVKRQTIIFIPYFIEFDSILRNVTDQQTKGNEKYLRVDKESELLLSFFTEQISEQSAMHVDGVQDVRIMISDGNESIGPTSPMCWKIFFRLDKINAT